jgi:hypothetical protein
MYGYRCAKRGKQPQMLLNFKLARVKIEAGFFIVASVLLACSVRSALVNYPNCIAYFNEFIGGPEHGAEYAIGSNVDWGQDLLFLKKWLDARPNARPFVLSYFGGMDASDIGIEYEPMPNVPPGSSHAQVLLQEGWYAISIDHLVRALEPGRENTVIASFRQRTPVARIGWSINVYHLFVSEIVPVVNRLNRKTSYLEMESRSK